MTVAIGREEQVGTMGGQTQWAVKIEADSRQEWSNFAVWLNDDTSGRPNGVQRVGSRTGADYADQVLITAPESVTFNDIKRWLDERKEAFNDLQSKLNPTSRQSRPTTDS